ncbi:YbjN domain-containing protein [uncultured Psychrobacter sp.]|uniref:YbjN domain-containing protein n=1 Tax=uncultured Psychrobacter sp. TaxID=259303 RepID=UPI002609E6E0|nr:YbjN domain-containing protein [uncultured Psychrobacter sp.]
MSQRNKLSLWQKLKRFLTASAPQAVIDDAKVSQSSLSLEADIDVDNDTDVNSDNKKDSDNAKSDSLKQTINQDKNTDIPIVNYLKQYFNDKQWHYTHYRPKTNDSQQSHHLSLRMRNKQLECGYLFRVQEKNNLLAVYGILPFLVPESHQNAAMLLITQINYDMLIGNLEMDVNDGEIRYKHAIDVEAVGIDDHILEHLLQSVIAMTTVAYEIFDDLINTQDPAEDIQTLLIELRQQADSRTFFLPTQFVQ